MKLRPVKISSMSSIKGNSSQTVAISSSLSSSLQLILSRCDVLYSAAHRGPALLGSLSYIHRGNTLLQTTPLAMMAPFLNTRTAKGVIFTP